MPRKSSYATQTDVAKKAGVTGATVSRALAGDPRILPATRQKIERIAHKMGYRRNPVVGQLMAELRKGQKESHKATLGILSPMMLDELQKAPAQRKFLEGATARAKELGYSVENFWMLEPDFTIARWKQILDTRNIRGLLFTGLFLQGSGFNQQAQYEDILKKFEPVWRDRACVVIGARCVNPSFHFASNDLYASGSLALEHLARLGYRRPAYIVQENLDIHLERRFTAGFMVEHEGIATSRDMIYRTKYPVDVPQMSQWIRQKRPDVIICGEDNMVDWLRAEGIRVPEDMGVIRVDLHVAEAGWAGVNQNSDLVAANAVDLLIGQMHHGDFGSPAFQKCVLVEGRWIAGKTVIQQTREKAVAASSLA